MSQRATLTLRKRARGAGLECVIQVHDPDLLGHRAKLSVEQLVQVKDSRAVNHRRSLATRKVHLSERETTVALAPIEAFSYHGKRIDIEVQAKLTVDDGYIFDTTVSQEQELSPGPRPEIASDPQSVVEPEDAFDFFANLKAVPFHNQIITMILTLVGGLVIAVNTLVGAHDQLAPETGTYFYSHRDSDGDSQSPFVNSLTGSGLIGATIWLLMRRQLRKYMSFRLTALPGRFRPETELPIRRILRGRSRVPLEKVTLRVVACNMEKGQYKRGSGTNERTVSFEEPVRAILLFEETVAHIPAGRPLHQCFDGVVYFERVFTDLYPPQPVSKFHGLTIHWEVQLLHPTFVDQELVGPTRFAYEDFWSGDEVVSP